MSNMSLPTSDSFCFIVPPGLRDCYYFVRDSIDYVTVAALYALEGKANFRGPSVKRSIRMNRDTMAIEFQTRHV